ncbi:hypothetical protein TRAPUB_7144 [Trametes pubescens]|uniref:Uncharacterized protein n=1 Tax=Trametes pubescens TaxID=154538 RepID=A0A1M2V422_TRAPU|nr:hypothetical protein TRAPUB_7144 [Trametes pubescens]
MSAISTTAATYQDGAMRQRPIGDILSEQFAPFDHRSKVVAPFDDETKRDAAFIEKLTRQRLNDFITRIKLALAALTGLGP